MHPERPRPLSSCHPVKHTFDHQQSQTLEQVRTLVHVRVDEEAELAHSFAARSGSSAWRLIWTRTRRRGQRGDSHFPDRRGRQPQSRLTSFHC
jgi:hypothetical protein